jgi:hypothetical protein
MRKAIGILVFVGAQLVVSCGSDSTSPTSDPIERGIYVLQSVNGETLPHLVMMPPCCQKTWYAGSLTVLANAQVARFDSIETVVNPMTSPPVIRRAGIRDTLRIVMDSDAQALYFNSPGDTTQRLGSIQSFGNGVLLTYSHTDLYYRRQ